MSSPVWTILSNLGSQFLPRPTAMADIAIARVSDSGVVREINDLGVEVLGWSPNDRLSARLTNTIKQIDHRTPSRLAIGGDGFRCMGIRLESGGEWLIIGTPTAVSDMQVFTNITADLHVPVARLSADGKLLYTNRAFDECANSELRQRFESDNELRETVVEAIDSARKNDWTHVHLPIGSNNAMSARVFFHRAGTDEVFDVVGDEPSPATVADPLQSATLWHNAFLEQSPIGIVHLGHDGMVAFENHSVRQIIGESVDDVWLGRHISDLTLMPKQVSKEIQLVLQDGQKRLWTNTRLGDRLIDIQGTCVRDFDGRISGAVLMLEDVTSERTQSAELALRARYRQAQADLRQLALGSQTESSFIEGSLSILGYALNASEIFVARHAHPTGECRNVAGWALDGHMVPTGPFLLSEVGWLNDLAESAKIGILRHPIPKEIPIHVRTDTAIWIPFFDTGLLGGFVIAGRDYTSYLTNEMHNIERDLIQNLISVFESLWAWVRVGTRYRLTVGTIADALFQYHLDGTTSARTYSFTTEQFYRLTGLAPIETDGGTDFWTTQMKGAVSAADRDALDVHHAKLFLGEPSTVDYRIKRDDGELRWIREDSSVLERNARGVEVAGIMSDITEQKQAEDVLRESKKEAERAAIRKGTMINTMSHELRTPIGAIQGFSDLLLAEVEEFGRSNSIALPKEINEFAETIKERSTSLMAVLDNLFDLSQLDSGMLQVHKTKVKAGLLVNSISDFGKSLATSRVGFKSICDFDLDREVEIDVYRIEQIVRLLIDNAFKFTERGKVLFGVQEDRGHLELAICDTGIGFDADKLDLLSEPFEQEDNRLNRSFEGVGLGLSIVRQLSDLMGLGFTVQSEKGTGSRFSLTIPLAA